MSKPAVMQATYVDAKFMPGLKVMRIALDLPIERSNEFLTMFGAPDRASPVWCAVARLAEPNAGEESGDVGKSETPKGVVGTQMPRAGSIPASRSLTRSQLAAVKLQKADFQNWLVDTYWTGKEEVGDYDGLLKRVLLIGSKSELDTNPEKAEAWDRLLTSFDTRGMTR